MSYHNCIAQRRPTSTFEAFEIYNEEQREIVEIMASLAAQVVNGADAILANEYPFPHGQIIFLWSEVGRGKTHLLEAFANSVISAVPAMEQRIYLSRSNFCHDNMSFADTYDQKPIILIDDMFSELQSVDQMHPATDLKALMNFFTMCYERRPLVICSSNFSLLQDGMLSRIGQADKLGRAMSRAKELLSTAGEIYLPGKDFREELAARRTGNKKSGKRSTFKLLS